MIVAGGLEVTAQEKRATEPSVTTIGTGCNTNSEIPVKQLVVKAGGISKSAITKTYLINKLRNKLYFINNKFI